MAKFDETSSTDAAGGRATSSLSGGSSATSSLSSSTSASRERLDDDCGGGKRDHDPSSKATLSMDREVEAAATFLTDIIKASRFNDQTMDSFRQALTTLLKQHYDGHWYPNDPFKGSGYRCLRVNGVMNPLLTKAAQLSGLPMMKFRHAFPVEFTVWVDPGDVSVRYGEDGSIGCVYPSSGKGLKHDHQQMEDLKKLVQLQKQQQQHQLQHLLQQQAASHFSSMMSSHHQTHRACSTPPPAPVCEKVHVSMNHRGSPNTTTMTTFIPGSPPSSSFMFSPYDGKCLKFPSSATGSAHYPQNLALSSRFNDQSPPSRKYQAIVQQSVLDRRTPPAYASASSPSTNMFSGGGGGFYAASDLIGTKNSFSSANQNSNRMMLDCDNIALARRTPPFRTMTPTKQNLLSPMSYQQQQADSSDWLYQSSPPINSDYQFYTNTHFGSSFTNNATSSRLVEPLGVGN